jgi:hypothetical protein
MVQQSIEPHTTSSMPSARSAPIEVPRGDLRKAALAHARAAMLAEFNGTYELAEQHREAAQRLRRAAADADAG